MMCVETVPFATVRASAMSQVLDRILDSEGNFPSDFLLHENAASLGLASATVAFKTGVDRRDVFLGERRCIVCGRTSKTILKHCYVNPQAQQDWVSHKGVEG